MESGLVWWVAVGIGAFLVFGAIGALAGRRAGQADSRAKRTARRKKAPREERPGPAWWTAATVIVFIGIVLVARHVAPTFTERALLLFWTPVVTLVGGVLSTWFVMRYISDRRQGRRIDRTERVIDFAALVLMMLGLWWFFKV